MVMGYRRCGNEAAEWQEGEKEELGELLKVHGDWTGMKVRAKEQKA
jgi:hypothetical protein